MPFRASTQFFVRLFIVVAIVSTVLTVAAPGADANEFRCPGVHNVEISTRKLSNTVWVDLDWENPVSYFDAVTRCAGDMIGFAVFDKYGDMHRRYEWTALEFVQYGEEDPAMWTGFGRYIPEFFQMYGCDGWSVVLYVRDAGDQHIGTMKYTETVPFDWWGLSGCKQVQDVVRPAPRITRAPVVSENPPTFEP